MSATSDAVGWKGPPLRRWGQGAERVLLLHGLGASSHVFDAVIEHASARFTFGTMDLPNSGEAGPYAPMWPEALADVVASLLVREAFAPCLVAGHSFGGVVALELAARWPVHVLGAGVMSAPALGVANMRSLLRIEGLDALAALGGRVPVLRPLVKLYLGRIWGSRAPFSEAHVDAYARAAQAQGFLHGMLDAGRALADYRLKLVPTVPVKLLWGDEDRVVPLEQGRRLAEFLGAPLEILPRVGHCVPEEHPEAVTRLLERLQFPEGSSTSRIPSQISAILDRDK